MKTAVQGSTGAGIASEDPQGLFRAEVAGLGRSVQDLFSNLRRTRVELIAEHPERQSRAARLLIDRKDGHGTWEFYRLEEDLFLVTGDLLYDTPSMERVPGEALAEFHLRLSGKLQMDLPGQAPFVIEGPSMLIWRQPQGLEITESTASGIRDTSVTLYCKPRLLRALAARNGIAPSPLLDEIERDEAQRIWYRQLPLSAGLMYVGRSLLQNPFKGGVRLLHAEAKVLELLCELLHMLGAGDAVDVHAQSDAELKRLDAARRIVRTQMH